MLGALEKILVKWDVLDAFPSGRIEQREVLRDDCSWIRLHAEFLASNRSKLITVAFFCGPLGREPFRRSVSEYELNFEWTSMPRGRGDERMLIGPGVWEASHHQQPQQQHQQTAVSKSLSSVELPTSWSRPLAED